MREFAKAELIECGTGKERELPKMTQDLETEYQESDGIFDECGEVESS